ncbi:MAG: hypothetical protein IJW08_03155 [Lentisphaeria bacterium]|nr:hypothetical protein [Lentisphaeria bacterium]
MTLRLVNQKKYGIGDRKDFGRVEASLYLTNKGLLALTSFAQDSFSEFRKTVEDSWHADSGKLMP